MRRMSRVPDRIPPGPIKLTYEDYVDLPDDGKRYEILDGELEVSPAPAPRHQGVSRNLLLILQGHVQERRLGTIYYALIDVLLADTSIVQPDLIFVAAGRESIITARAIEGPPDLVVEILSPWSVRRDRRTKAKLYARFGIPTTGSWMPTRGHSSSMRRGVPSTGSSPRTRATRRWAPRSSPPSPSPSAAA